MNDSKSLPRREANAADFNDISNKNEYQIWTDKVLTEAVQARPKSITNCKVTRYTRAGKNGRAIVCPDCGNIIRIYHFNFSGLTCPQCKQSVAKYDWKVRTTEGKSASAIQDKLGTDSNTHRREDT